MVDLTIIIVNYKMLNKTLNCLDSICSSNWSGITYEIILVDNDSGDNTQQVVKQKYPKVKFIQSKTNLGMGKGYNLGLRNAVGEYQLILNPDTIVEKDSLRTMITRFRQDSGIGMMGPKLLYPDNTLQYSCFRFPQLLTPFYRRTVIGKYMSNKVDLFLMKDYNLDSELEVDWLMGSCLLTKKSVLDAVGLFDERFFMYFEDTDLCRRIKKANYKVVYYPKAIIHHHHSRASAKEPWYLGVTKNKLARIHIESYLKYFWKWKL